MGGEFVKFQIRGRVDEHLVDGIDVDVVRRDVFQVNAVDLRADLDVTGHARNGNHIVKFQRRICLQFRSIGRLARKLPSGGSVAAFSVDCPYSLDDLKQPRSAGDSVGFQRRGNGKADRLFCPALIGNDKIGGHGIKIAIHALHGGIKGLQVNSYVCAVRHQSSSLRFAALMMLKL